MLQCEWTFETSQKKLHPSLLHCKAASGGTEWGGLGKGDGKGGGMLWRGKEGPPSLEKTLHPCEMVSGDAERRNGEGGGTRRREEYGRRGRGMGRGERVRGMGRGERVRGMGRGKRERGEGAVCKGLPWQEARRTTIPSPSPSPSPSPDSPFYPSLRAAPGGQSLPFPRSRPSPPLRLPLRPSSAILIRLFSPFSGPSPSFRQTQTMRARIPPSPSPLRASPPTSASPSPSTRPPVTTAPSAHPHTLARTPIRAGSRGGGGMGFRVAVVMSARERK
ncbi:unnamed protein product [Closterium sp. NIES-53]